MNKERDPKIGVALITGGLGCLGTICAAVIAGWFALAKDRGPSTIVIIPTNPPAITQVVPTAPETVLEVINNGTDFICYLYMVPIGAETWGDDWLGSGETIPPNESREFIMESGTYHLRAENCDGELISQIENTQIQGDQWWTVK